jgi:hypothetical protein
MTKSGPDSTTPNKEDTTQKTSRVVFPEVSGATMLNDALSHVHNGVRNIEAARSSGYKLRDEYKKKANNHRNAKIAALAAETVLMAFYGYGAVEHYTGYKGSTTAVVANGAVSGGISVIRASVQYGLMKRGEEALKAGNKARGMLFTGIGLGLATINALFVAVGFAEKYIVQEQGSAGAELEKLSTAESGVHTAKSVEVDRINAEINALDEKIAAIRSGSGDPRLVEIDNQMQRIAAETDVIRNHPNFNDGRETEWDRTARTDMNRNNALLDNLSEQKNEILRTSGSNLTAEQQQMLDATTEQRLKLNQQIKDLDDRFSPQIEALQTSRKLWEAKLSGAAEAGNSWGALKSNPTILIEALANVAAVSVANWWAATEGHKQEMAENILSGTADDPWAAVKPAGKEQDTPQTFAGYNYAADAMYHLEHQAILDSISRMLGNDEALRLELKLEISRQHAKFVHLLNAAYDEMPESEYKQQLKEINTARNKALNFADRSTTLLEKIRLVTADAEKYGTVEEAKIPVFKDAHDKKFQKLEKGKIFKTPDGQIRVKF